MSIPFLMDTTPPIFAEMKAMKEQMEVMMNALKGRVSNDLDDLVNRTDSPFTIQVNSCPYHRSSECRRLRATMELMTY